jgi:hypothetical protein
MNLELLEFQKRFAGEISAQIFDKTLWNPSVELNKEAMYSLACLNRPPFGSQVENGILPLVAGINKYKFGLLIAEMGTGKTQMSYSAAYLLIKDIKDGRKRKILFLTAGGKHLPKMIKEAKAIYGEQVIVKTIVNKYATDKIGKDEITPEQVYEDVAPEGQFIVYVMSKDTAKMDLSEEAIYNFGDTCPECHTKILPKSHKRGKKLSTRIKPYECPNCAASLVSKVSKNICQHSFDNKGVPVSRKYFKNFKFDKLGNGILNEKGEPVFVEEYTDGIFPKRIEQQRKTGNRKISIGKRFRKLQKNSKDKIFEVLIVDEVHEMQSGTSLQGRVYRDLVNVSRKSMIMTGTLSNGYPSSVFFILQAIMPNYFKRIGYEFKDVGKFVDHYGSRKFTRSRDIIEKQGSKTFIKVNELPKISDRIVSLMAPFTVWLKMEDLNLKMPSYTEKAIISQLDDRLLIRLNDFKRKSLDLLSKYNPKLVKSFGQRFMYLQNNPSFAYKFEFEGLIEVINEETKEVKVEKRDFESIFEAFDSKELFNKEKDLIREVLSQYKRNRKILIYSIYNKAAYVANRIQEILSTIEDVKLDIRILPDSISGERIEPWIEENDECDILIASPLKLATGLDLCQFPTIMFYESGINLRVAQQAARRSWRAVGQDHPVEVLFFAYEGIQAHILDIMAKKMRAAATIEGTKVMEGQIASVFDDDADFTAALNSIADDLKVQYQPDFSSSTVEEGKLRPATLLEEAFDKILLEVNPTKIMNQIEEVESIEKIEEVESIEKIEEIESVEKIEEIESVEKIEEVESIEKIEEIESVEKREEEQEKPEEINIKISNTGQLMFEF